MCRMLYVASNKYLSLIKWDENHPDFHIVALLENDKSVLKQFTKKHVVYAGSHEGCGCGFSYGQMPVEDEEDEKQDKAARESNERLKQYLRDHLCEGGPIQVFACWDGDQGEEPEKRVVLKPEEINGETFEVLKPVFYEIRNGS